MALQHDKIHNKCKMRWFEILFGFKKAENFNHKEYIQVC